ncbi:hypothetical protein BJY52DRAFT_1300988, partial [Lactarius psammicola]
VLAFGTAVGFAIFLAACYLQSPWRKPPPGPRQLLGNALPLRVRLRFMRWMQELAGRSIVVLNTQRVAANLQDRRFRIMGHCLLIS